MADQPVPDLPDAANADVPRVMGVRADSSLALTPTGLPLTGGTLTGDLSVGGKILGKVGGQATPSYGFAGDTEGLGLYASVPSQWLRFTTGGEFRLQVHESAVIVYTDLTVTGTINGTLAFGIAPDIDTADVLDRAETATMPATDEDGIATEDVLTVNEVLTALLDEVRTLNARLNALETS